MVKKIKKEMNISRFEKIKNGWIKDFEMGVEWGPSSPNSLNYKDAEKYCVGLGGHLPTIKELQSLVDYERENPAINVEFFGDTKSNWYWSSTVTAWNPSARWCVVFFYGFVYFNSEDDSYYVRPCRSSQC